MLSVRYVHIPVLPEPERIIAALREKVPAETREEVANYRNTAILLRRLVGEVLVREIIRREALADTPIRIEKGGKGKPYVAGNDGLYFNISHSGEYLVAAFSDRETGIDIEQRKRARMAVASRFFHPSEVAELLRFPLAERNRLFADYWAVKESFLKWLGTGLSRPLNTFRVEFAEKSITLFEGSNKLPLVVTPCEIDKDYACYVCSDLPTLPDVRSLLLEELL